MLYTRYHLAGTFSQQKDVLEVACGPGIGLGYLGRQARRIVGGDYDEQMLRTARAHYGGHAVLLRLDAHALPFTDGSFDLVILFEALYYLAEPQRFVAEARRVLRLGGTVLVSTVNREWPEFNPSPFTYRYFSAPELRRLLAAEGFAVELMAGFPAATASPRDLLLRAARRVAVGLHLIPRTMKGKQVLKRLIYGRLQPLPAEAEEGMAEPSPLIRLDGDGPVRGFKVLYAIGRSA